ncbi:hypothetical protein K7432_015942 [Basidiobolus ranarum]|uniref:Uncharacterized protein n=1 Tax=Basidiobolus ranarum TaxID=34480 RepID=A0ABR2VMB7_9FUNG
MNIEQDIHIRDVLPTIKCTDCGREVDLLLLEEHKCSPRSSLEHEVLLSLNEDSNESDIFSERFPTFQFRKSSIYSIDSEDYDEPESQPSSPPAGKGEEFIEKGMKNPLDFLNIYNDMLSNERSDKNERGELEVDLTKFTKKSGSDREVKGVSDEIQRNNAIPKPSTLHQNSSNTNPLKSLSIGKELKQLAPPSTEVKQERSRSPNANHYSNQNNPKSSNPSGAKGSSKVERSFANMESRSATPNSLPTFSPMKAQKQSEKTNISTSNNTENTARSVIDYNKPIPIPNGNGNAKDISHRPEIVRPGVRGKGLPPPGSIFTTKAPESLE